MKRRFLNPGKWVSNVLIFLMIGAIIHFLFVYRPGIDSGAAMWAGYQILSTLGLAVLIMGIISETTTLVGFDFYEEGDGYFRFAHYRNVIRLKFSLFFLGVFQLIIGYLLNPDASTDLVLSLFQDIRLGAGLFTASILIFQISKSYWRLVRDQDDFLEINSGEIRWYDNAAGVICKVEAVELKSIHIIYEDSADTPDVERIILFNQTDRFEIDLEQMSLLPQGRKILEVLYRYFSSQIEAKSKEFALDTEEPKIGILNVLVVVLSLYVLGALTVQTFMKLSPEVSDLLDYIDHFICGFFLIEFFVRFFRADNKWKFMRWGWIDFISSIPMVDFVRAGRILRLIRLLRVIRAFRSTHNLLNHLFASRANGAFTSLAVLAILMVIFSALAILQVEADAPGANILTAGDAMWWAYVTITTVGYGDKYPVTIEGRIIAAVLMTVGVGLFGTFTAFVASWFVEDKGMDSKKSLESQSKEDKK